MALIRLIGREPQGDNRGAAPPSTKDRGWPEVLEDIPSKDLSKSDVDNGAIDWKIVTGVQTFYEGMFLEMGLPITYLAFRIDREGEYVHPVDFDEEYWREQEGPRRTFSHQPAKKPGSTAQAHKGEGRG